MNALREPMFLSAKKSYPASTSRIRLPVVASGIYARSPMLRNKPIWMPPKKEIGTTTKLWGSVAGRTPSPAGHLSAIGGELGQSVARGWSPAEDPVGVGGGEALVESECVGERAEFVSSLLHRDRAGGTGV